MKGLYVHVPFCRRRCAYCDFVVTPSGRAPKRARFLDALSLEAEARAVSGPFDTLYLGGGTPSALDDSETERLFGILSRFPLKKGAEVTIEVNPGDVTPERARLYASLGVNRASVGVQSFHERTLLRTNRAHGVKEIPATFDALRGAGIGNVSADLILGLPGETASDAFESAEKLAALAPAHVSIYELTIEEGAPFGKLHRQGKLPLPPEEDTLRALLGVRERLAAAGFEHYELLSFAKKGFRSRHNLLYWANAEYLGLGPGAYSYIKGRRSRLAASYESYVGKAEAGDWSAADEETLEPERVPFESFLLSLRLLEGTDEARFPKVIAALAPTLSRLEADGLVERARGKVRLTARGTLFAETVFAELSLPDRAPVVLESR